ncbi:hypothetical protein M758_12G004500 [Ceratodon purpureus]|nr:hypothetical protein M758_12G004500 [Ceratodon purpureus]
MASFSEEDGMLQIPATSPCRRDYHLRSFSPAQLSEYETSRPQSPWLPRSESRSEKTSTFCLYGSSPAPLDQSNCYSGPLPAARQGVPRSYYSGPLPSSSPLPSYFSGGALPDFMTTTTESFAFRGRARGCHARHSGEVSSVSGRLPEVGSSRECSFREEEGLSLVEGDDDVDEVGEVLYTSYLRRKEEGRSPLRSSRMASPSPANSLDLVALRQSGRMRNCVSGELGTRFELAQQRAQVARGYKSGEIVGLEICADGIYPSPDMRSEVEALVKVGREISMRKQMSLESMVCETRNDDESERRNSELAMVAVPLNGAVNERLISESAMVAIPFKWEEIPVKRGDSSKKVYSRTSSGSRPARITSEQKVMSESQIAATKEPSFGNSHRFYDGAKKGSELGKSERWSESESDVKRVLPAHVKLEKSSSISFSASSSVSSAKPKGKRAGSSAVPFKWEVEPGKPKVEEKASRSPEAAPALQLPPRLASTSSSRRNSCSASGPPSRRNSMVAASGNRARQPSPSLSASVVSTSSSVGKPSLQSQKMHSPPQPSPSSQVAKPRHTLATVFRSSPLSSTAGQSDCTPKRGSSGPISSQFGSPQYQSVEYLCEDPSSWNRVHSPTSTLCGPGSDSHSNPSSCKSDKSSRKSSVSFPHSYSSTSAESFEQWSYGDHISPTSRHPSIREFSESEGFSRANSVRGHDEVADRTMTKLRRKLNLKSSSSKPPMSSILSSHAAHASSSRSVDANEYSSHGEEYFDCQGSGSLPSPSSNPKIVEHSDVKEEAEAEPPTRLPYKMPSPVHDIEPKEASPSPLPTRGGSEFSNCLALRKFLSKGESPRLWMENPSWDLSDAPTNIVEDGYRSPAYKATLELLSPSPNLMSKKSGSRSVAKLPRSSSSQRRHPHLVEVLCNSLRQSLHRCTKRSVARTQSIVLNEDQFTKRHQSFMW